MLRTNRKSEQLLLYQISAVKTVMSSLLMRWFLVLIPFLLLSGCSFHTHADKFSGIAGINGEPVEYQQTNTWALHALWIFPIVGDASIENSVNEFSIEARKRRATRINIEETSSFTYWFVFPPFSFLIHPVNTTISGNVEGTIKKMKK